MTEQELLQMRDLAEDGKLQFKERANDRYDISCEIVGVLQFSWWTTCHRHK